MTRIGYGSCENTYHGSTLRALTEAMERFRNPCDIIICASDEWTLYMMTNKLEEWEESNFLNPKGEPIRFQEEWIRLRELTKEYNIKIQPGKHSYSSWLQEQMKRGIEHV